MSFSKKATGRFQVGSWKETVYADIDEGEGTTAGEAYYPKRGLTHAQVEYTYRGDIEGTSVVGYLIAYKEDAAPVFAFERFTGSIGGQEGSCVFRHVGTQDAGSVGGHLEVVPGMGTGGLEKLRGEADLSISGHSEDGYELALSYELD
jgi:uncharacterized protein DUF3224